MAKGIGNGFPLAAVVTTPGKYDNNYYGCSSNSFAWLYLSLPSYLFSSCFSVSTEIAQTMGKALHFNTYGGNPMACTVGSAVMDVSVIIIIR